MDASLSLEVPESIGVGGHQLLQQQSAMVEALLRQFSYKLS